MRRLLSVLMVLCVIAGMGYTGAAAESADYAGMTIEELLSLNGIIQKELHLRQTEIAPDVMLIDYEGVTVYLTGKHEFSNGIGTPFFRMEFVIVNNTDHKVSVSIDSPEVNGWVVSTTLIAAIDPGTKKRDKLVFNCEGAAISTFEEIEQVNFKLSLKNMEDHKVYYTTEPIVIYPQK